MSITVEQIFNKAMDLMDKRNSTGMIDATKTSRYKVRTPSILDIWQNENFNNGNLFSTHEIICTSSEPQTWVKYTMPNDFRNIDQIIKIETIGVDETYTKFADYKWEGMKDLYVSSLFEGTIRIIYKPVPVAITNISQTFGLDDITTIGASYFLAAHLLLTEDPSTANFFNERYMEYRANVNIKNPTTSEDIIDVYGW